MPAGPPARLRIAVSVAGARERKSAAQRHRPGGRVFPKQSAARDLWSLVAVTGREGEVAGEGCGEVWALVGVGFQESDDRASGCGTPSTRR